MSESSSNPATRVTLVTGGNQGLGLQVAAELAVAGHTVIIGSRDLGRGETAAASIGPGAHAVELDVTDASSVARAGRQIQDRFGRLDVLVNNAAISHDPSREFISPDESAASVMASTASLEEIRTVWETNVFGVITVYQAMLPLLRLSSDARIVNVSSVAGSMTANADPSFAPRSAYGPTYSASKAGLNAMSLAMIIELENTDIKVNVVSPGFGSTALNNYAGTESPEEAAREIVRVALYGEDGPHGTFTSWENTPVPW